MRSIGKKACVLMIALLAIGVGACNKKGVRPVIKPAQPVPVSPPPVPVPATWPELPLPPSRLPDPPEPALPKSFRDGEASFQSGKYQEAIRSYEQYVREDPVTQYKDAAIFRLGISHALACTNAECRARALDRSQEQFRRLVNQYPKSPYSVEARFILSLQTDIEKMAAEAKSRDEKMKTLNEELEQLKKIDLERQPPRIKK